MKLEDIQIEDVQKAGTMLIALATAGYQIYNKIKESNPEMTLEDFVAGIKEAQGIPTDWNTVYEE
jgi:hypothetical protein